MPESNSILLLAEYNQLMNQRQFAAAALLPDADLYQDKGAFFKSVFGTLNHILVGDVVWLKRFATHFPNLNALSCVREWEWPSSLAALLHNDLEALKTERELVDQALVDWCRTLSDDNLKECVEYSNMAGMPFKKPLESLIHHLFLHQTHHRGQITTLLSQFGVEFGETDFVEIIDNCG